MNKAILAVGAMLMLGGSMQVNADTKICVFDLLGKSVDAIGAVPSYAIAQKAISFALDKRNQRRLISSIGNQVYEVVGISQIGLAYIFVKDKKMDTIEQIKGKKFAVLAYDEAQKIVVKSLGGQAVLSDISDIA